ncbi:MAG: DegT/DnrJ/EryC1/StrS family aminotransferase [Acidobacteriota bacterium]
MTAVNEKRERKPKHGNLFVSALPPLHPAMIFPQRSCVSNFYPFSHPGLEYFYCARNGIYALARSWKLAGKEVLFPAYFHGVELEALLAAGVVPKFYPVHKGMLVDGEEIKSLITTKTSAVYVIHYLGFPGPVQQILEVCRSRNLLLVEDCALALLSRTGTIPLGSLGDAAIFCLYKTLPLPNGGAVLIQGPGLHKLSVRCSSSFFSEIAYSGSLISSNFKFSTGGPVHRSLAILRKQAKAASHLLGVVEVGTEHFDPSLVNVGMSKLSQRILAGQDFDQIVEQRRRNFLHLLDRLRGFCDIVFTQLPEGVCPLAFPIYVREKEPILERLLTRGIQAVNFWSVHHPLLPAGVYPDVDEMRKTVLEIPCHQGLTSEAVDRVADELITVLLDLDMNPSQNKASAKAPTVLTASN